MDEPGHEKLAERVEAALRRVQGVRWATVNGVLGRVVVALDEDGPSLAELIEVVGAVEAANHQALHGSEGFSRERPEHPADVDALRRNAIAIGADVAALGASLFGQLLALTPLPAELASLVSVVENEPRLRSLVERRVGVAATDLGLGVANAAAQAIAQGPLGLAVDVAHRANLLGELQARRRCWERMGEELHEGPACDDLAPVARTRRPVPLPPGAAERYADVASLASLGAFGASLAITGSPRRSAAFIVAGLPKGARHGREAFSARVGRELARRDVVVMDGAALRVLDRVDTVLLDASVLDAGSHDAGPYVAAIVEAARAGGMAAVLAGGTADLGRALGITERAPGGARLEASIRRLQADNRVVLLVSCGGAAGAPGALLAADCSVGVGGSSPQPPWGADLLVGPDLRHAVFVVEAAVAARRVAVDSTRIALAGAAAGAVWSVAGPAAGAGSRAAAPMNVAALAAQVHGMVAAAAVARRPVAVPVAAALPWHAMDADDVLAALGSSADGLSAQEAARRARSDDAPPSPATRAVRAVWAELANPLTPLLAAGAGLSAAVGSMSDAVLVGGVTAVNAVIGAGQRVRADVSIGRLADANGPLVTVVRPSERTVIDPHHLVQGDVVSLSAGDVVPSDCRVLAATACEADESVLTGESMPVAKRRAAAAPGAAVADRPCMLYEGTTVSSGEVLGVVVAVGDETEVGRSLADAPEPPPSGVEARLGALTAATLPVTVASGATVTGLGLLRGRSPRRAVTSGVGLTVASVPEGLPLLATSAQQASARRLSARGALVRNPRAIEALGRVDTLCFDKTGTLTVGEIVLRRVSDGAHDQPLDGLGRRTRSVLAAALRASPAAAGGDVHALPHATDRAVVTGGARAGVAAAEDAKGWHPVAELAFDPERGFHAVLGAADGPGRLSVKGAPEEVLGRAVRWQTDDGPLPIDAACRRRLRREAERLAALGLRVLAVAERPAPGARAGRDGAAGVREEDVAGLTLLGFLALADGVRPSAAEAVADLRAAGVEVVMITGDHPQTATAIAREVGILNGHQVVTGGELASMDDAALDDAIAGASVFARVTPTDKVRIVRALQRAGRVVAMTGDGANDAPAIRLAHTGIALGSRGSPAAREAADLVVVDDRMETILDAIIEGRSMWISVRDALSILVGGNLGEVAFSLATTALTGASPLGARQFLLVNLLTDMLPAMAIALRPPARTAPETLLAEGPDKSLGASLVRQIALRAAATGAGATSAWALARVTGRGRRASTVALAALIGTQLAQTAAIGWDSPVVLVSTAASAAALVLIVQTPGVSHFFGCTPLGPLGWSIAAGSAATATAAAVLAPVAVQRLGARRRDRAHHPDRRADHGGTAR